MTTLEQRSAGTPVQSCEQMRELLKQHRMDNPIVGAAMNVQRCNGLSDCDAMTMLAYHAIVALEAVTASHVSMLERMRSNCSSESTVKG